MRAMLAAVFVLTACAQPGPNSATSTPTSTPPIATSQPQNISVQASAIREDLARLDEALRAPGVIVAGLNETADLGNGLTVRPLEVLEDSRCPADVTCIWAGRVRLRAAIAGMAGDSILIANQPLQTPHGALVLSVVSPGKWASWPTNEIGPRPAYRFGFTHAS